MTVPLLEVHLRTDFIDEPVLCGLVQDLPEGIDFLIGNDIWLKSHPLPDEVIEQAVLTRSAVKQANQSINNDPTIADLQQFDAEIDLSSITDRNGLIEL